MELGVTDHIAVSDPELLSVVEFLAPLRDINWETRPTVRNFLDTAILLGVLYLVKRLG